MSRRSTQMAQNTGKKKKEYLAANMIIESSVGLLDLIYQLPAVTCALFVECYCILGQKQTPKYQVIIDEDSYNVIVLHKLVKKIYNSSASIIVDYVLGNILEALRNFLLIKGNKYPSLAKYLEAAK